MPKQWPSLTEYDLIMNNMGSCVITPQFKNAMPIQFNKKNTSGRLVSYPGGYSVVYPIIVGSNKFAFRGWTSDPNNARQRYIITSEYLKRCPSQYFVSYEYIDEAFKWKGNNYPIIGMEWIDGQTLTDFINENINDRINLLDVAEKFKSMVSELHRMGISHGDLQDGNVMICRKNQTIKIKLVDYDSLFVPPLEGYALTGDELPGYPAYQHPGRLNQSNEKADYFSELVIYLSFCAYAESPNLWESNQEKQLLFKREDFICFSIDPSNSEIYKKLQLLSPNVKHLTRQLVEFCRQKDTSQLIPLENVLLDRHKNIARIAPSISGLDQLDEVFYSNANTTETQLPLNPVPTQPKDYSEALDELNEFFYTALPAPIIQPTLNPVPTQPKPVAPKLEEIDQLFNAMPINTQSNLPPKSLQNRNVKKTSATSSRVVDIANNSVQQDLPSPISETPRSPNWLRKHKIALTVLSLLIVLLVVWITWVVPYGSHEYVIPFGNKEVVIPLP